MDTKIHAIFEYEFRRGTNAAETTWNINDVYEAETSNERSVRFWLARFRSGNVNTAQVNNSLNS